jgi:phage terminase small subunit
MALTPKQAAFVREYLVDLNATKAATRAGYSAKTAGSVGHDLLKKPEIALAIREAMDRRANRVEVKQDDVLGALLRVLNADLGKAFDADGKLLRIHEMPPEVRLVISGFEQEALFEGGGQDKLQVGVTTKVKLWSKDKALELAMRHLGLLNDKLEATGKDGAPLAFSIIRKPRGA